MITREVCIRYIVSCDECGAKLGDIEPVDNHIPRKEEILWRLAMHHTEDGKDICSACFTKNFGKCFEPKSANSIDKC